METLTRNHAAYVAEYAIDGDIRAAYVRAGMAPGEKGYNAHHLHNQPHIQEAIAANAAMVRKQYESTADSVLDVMSKMVIAHKSDGYGPDGKILPIDQWPSSLTDSVKSIDFDEQGNVESFRLHNGTQAIAQLLKNLNLLEEKRGADDSWGITIDEKDMEL